MAGSTLRIFNSFTAADVALTAATEAVVVTVPGISTDGPGQRVRLLGFITLLTAAGATTVTLRWRQTGLTGTLVGEANTITVAATTSYEWPHNVEDTPGEVASLPYVLTATVAGGNATAQMMMATALVAS